MKSTMYQMNRPDPVEVLGFGAYSFDTTRLELRKSGQTVPLAAQPAQVLGLLLDRAGHVVTRSEIRELLWGDRAVEVDAGINACIRQIRRTLGDRHRTSAYVETIPRVGYRFAAPVRQDHEPIPSPAPAMAETDRTGRTGWRRPASTLVAGTILILAVVFAWSNRLTTKAEESAQQAIGGHPEPTSTRLAILPFQDLSPTGDGSRNSALATGMADDLIAELNGVAPQRLQVIARHSTFSIRSPESQAANGYQRVASTLNVDYLLDGSVRRESDRIRVVVKLVRAADLRVVWSRRLDREVERILDVQLDLARQVARSLLPNVELAAGQIVLRSRIRPEAREPYLLGRHLVERRNREDDLRAIPLLEQAARLDPGHAPILVVLSQALRSRSGVEVTDRRRALLKKALELDPNSAEAHLLLGRMNLFRDWNWHDAGTALEHAVELQPNLADARHTLATFYAMRGRSEDAVLQIEVARKLDPVSAALQADSGLVYFLSRRFGQAIDACRLALQLEPSRLGCRDILIESHRLLGDVDAARYEALAMLSARGGDLATKEAISNVSAREGLTVYYRWNLSDLTRRGASDLEMAAAHVAVGNVDSAFRHLQLALDQRASQALLVVSDPRADAFRSDPRFVEFQRRVGLGEGAREG